MNEFNDKGERHGPWEEYSVNGTLFYRENYINGKKHGLCECYYSNGNLMDKENYINGNKHGLSEKYNEDDKLYLKTILSMNKYNENGFREGFWEEYDYSINLMCRENYVNGKLSGIKEWYYIGPNNFYKDELKLKEYYL